MSWDDEFIERLTNARLDAFGNIIDDVWHGPYAWRMHRDWLFEGARSTNPAHRREPLFKHPAPAPGDIVSTLNVGVPEKMTSNPRLNWNTVAPGPQSVAQDPPNASQEVIPAMKAAKKSKVLSKGESDKIVDRFYRVLRMQILRKERQACKRAVEEFAKRAENQLIGTTVATGTITTLANAWPYTQDTQDPVPGGEWY